MPKENCCLLKCLRPNAATSGSKKGEELAESRGHNAAFSGGKNAAHQLDAVAAADACGAQSKFMLIKELYKVKSQDSVYSSTKDIFDQSLRNNRGGHFDEASFRSSNKSVDYI